MKRGTEFRERFTKDYQTLNALYESSVSDEEKRTRKKEIIEKLRTDLGIKRKITNAALIQFKTYHADDSGFWDLFNRAGQDVRAFMNTVAQLKDKDFPGPQSEDFTNVLKRVSVVKK